MDKTDTAPGGHVLSWTPTEAAEQEATVSDGTTTEEAADGQPEEVGTSIGPPPEWYLQLDWLSAQVDLGPWGKARLEDCPQDVLREINAPTLAMALVPEAERMEAAIKAASEDPMAFARTIAPYVVAIEGGKLDDQVKVHDLNWWKKALGVIPSKVALRLQAGCTRFANSGDDEGND